MAFIDRHDRLVQVQVQVQVPVPVPVPVRPIIAGACVRTAAVAWHPPHRCQRAVVRLRNICSHTRAPARIASFPPGRRL